MTKGDNSAAAPTLRFPDFRSTAEWNTASLEDIAERVSTKNPKGAVTRVLTNSAEYGVLDQKDYFDREIATAGKLDGYYVVGIGDYVYNPRTSATAPVGPISRNNVGIGVMSPLYTVFRFNVENTDFFEHYFKTTGWHTYLRSAASTGARHDRMSITAGAIMRMPVPIPDVPEQKKIADCLTSLDEVIGAQGRKVEALRTYKRGLMQQLFPREGDSVPRLRFPEFREEPGWTSRRFGELLREIPRQIVMDDDIEYQLVTVKRRYGGVVSRERLKGRAIKVKSQFIVRTGDFLISKRQIVHNACGIVPPDLDESIVSNEYSVLGPKDGCNIEFFNYFSQQPAVSASFLHSSVGIVIEKMLFKLSAWLKYEFRFPDIEEQERIADVLASIEKTIAVETKQLEALKNHKNGLVQQLFPSQKAS